MMPALYCTGMAIAGERHHAGAKLDMKVVKRRLFQICLCNGYPP